jgi:hypothetical protein
MVLILLELHGRVMGLPNPLAIMPPRMAGPKTVGQRLGLLAFKKEKRNPWRSKRAKATLIQYPLGNNTSSALMVAIVAGAPIVYPAIKAASPNHTSVPKYE